MVQHRIVKYDDTGFFQSAPINFAMKQVIPQVIVSGVFDRFPRLKFLAVETGVGWVPHLLEMMDDRYWRNRHWTGIEPELQVMRRKLEQIFGA